MIELLYFSDGCDEIWKALNHFRDWINEKEKEGYVFLQVIRHSFDNPTDNYYYHAAVLFRGKGEAI